MVLQLHLVLIHLGTHGELKPSFCEIRPCRTTKSFDTNEAKQYYELTSYIHHPRHQQQQQQQDTLFTEGLEVGSRLSEDRHRTAACNNAFSHLLHTRIPVEGEPAVVYEGPPPPSAHHGCTKLLVQSSLLNFSLPACPQSQTSPGYVLASCSYARLFADGVMPSSGVTSTTPITIATKIGLVRGWVGATVVVQVGLILVHHGPKLLQ